MSHRSLLACLLLSALTSIAGVASADPFAPVSISPAPEGQGTRFSPGVRLISEIAPGYVEEEYIVSGSVDVFAYPDPPVRGDLREVPGAPSDYTTRIIIRRPSDPHDFDGTLVVEWWNSTAGFDTAPVWDPSAEFFTEQGWIYVGISNAPQSVGFLAAGCPFPGAACGTRYAGLQLPEQGMAYEMVSQIVNLLRSHDPDNPLGDDFRPHRVFHGGQSQQAGSVTTYANEFHNELNDGYFIQAGGSRARSLSTGSPNWAPTDVERLPRNDLPVPVIRAITETDLEVLGVIATGSRQVGFETENFRYYEMTGTAHNTVHEDIELIPAGVIGPAPVLIEDLCVNEFNTIADGPVFGSVLYNAMWRNLRRQSVKGIPMPTAEPVRIEGGLIVRDELGLAEGGLRVPDVNVPLASYASSNVPKPPCDFMTTFPPACDPTGGLGGLACLLSGSVVPFDAGVLEQLYPRPFSYRLRVILAAFRLHFEGFLVRKDLRRVVERALEVDLPFWP